MRFSVAVGTSSGGASAAPRRLAVLPSPAPDGAGQAAYCRERNDLSAMQPCELVRHGRSKPSHLSSPPWSEPGRVCLAERTLDRAVRVDQVARPHSPTALEAPKYRLAFPGLGRESERTESVDRCP
jgi:hypothetical protein